jgi:PIN domain nuclease of toxin-antitoxin system
VLLLDTHAIIWLDSGQPMAQPALEAIDEAAQAGAVLVSPVSAWELGLLVVKGRIVLDVGALDWFDRFLALPGVRLAPLTVAAAIGASDLPEGFHGDPADRLLVATARELNCPMVTRDRQILGFAAEGHVKVLPC